MQTNMIQANERAQRGLDKLLYRADWSSLSWCPFIAGCMASRTAKRVPREQSQPVRSCHCFVFVFVFVFVVGIEEEFRRISIRLISILISNL